MQQLSLVYIATLGWRIVGEDGSREAVANFEDGIARLTERSAPEGPGIQFVTVVTVDGE